MLDRARLAEALDYAHSRGVIHRDIKPGNIMISQYSRPMLVDFNLAFRPLACTRGDDDRIGGTLPYMAPEHLEAMNVEEHVPAAIVAEPTDIYSLGDGALRDAGRGLAISPWIRGAYERGVREMAAQRRQCPPALPPACPSCSTNSSRSACTPIAGASRLGRGPCGRPGWLPTVPRRSQGNAPSRPIGACVQGAAVARAAAGGPPPLSRHRPQYRLQPDPNH